MTEPEWSEVERILRDVPKPDEADMHLLTKAALEDGPRYRDLFAKTRSK